MIVGRLWSRIDPTTALRLAWPFVRRDRWTLARAGVAALLLTAIEISIPLMSRTYLDRITGSHPATQDGALWHDPTVLVGLLLAAALARGAVLAWQRALTGGIGERTAGRLRSRLWAHIQGLPVEKTQRRGPGRLLVRFVSDIRSVQRLVTDVLIQGTQDLLVATVVLVVLVLLNWRLAIPALLLVPTYAIIFGLWNPELRRLSRGARRRRTRLSAFLNERILGMKVVKAHVQERSEATRVRRMTRALAKRGTRLASTAATVEGATAAAVSCSLALTLALAPGEIAAGRLTAGTLLAVVMLLGMLAPVLRRIARLNRTAQEALISLTRLHETLDQRPEVGEQQSTARLHVRDGDVFVKGVSYTAPDGPSVLHEVSLEAHRGELVALIGPNGSGKSTLLDLMLRFKSLTAGRIVVDGRRIDNVSLASLRAQIGWVPQDAPLFDGTILDNITYGTKRPPSEAAIQRAVHRSGLDRVTARLPDGLRSDVGSGGRLLSHGERQRVALTRALLADPPILVLDELSSGVDAEADRAMAATLRALAQQKTLIVATHLIPLLLAADRIYVLEGGRLVEHGTHNDLLRDGTVYARLIGAKASAPLEGPQATLSS
jgi:ABC-type multidrug transport system fused ATPase/permease subunit